MSHIGVCKTLFSVQTNCAARLTKPPTTPENRDVVKAYRACTTRSEERALVKKESAHIRDLFREGDKAFRRRNVAKLLFFHMNGYETDFGMTECIKLCASNKYKDKRIAYLGLMILVDESEDILMLITNSLQTDLQSHDVNIVTLALNLLSDMASVEMVRDLLPEIDRHLHSSDAYIRKKAALAAVRAVRKLTPDETSPILEVIPLLFQSKTSRMYISAAALVSTLCKKGSVDVHVFQTHVVPVVVEVSSSFLLKERSHGSVASASKSSVKSPGVHVKLLSTIRLMLNAGVLEQQRGIVYELLKAIATTTEDKTLSGCSVLYECVRTIIAMNPDQALWDISISVLVRFLSHKEATVRYIGLQELISVADIRGTDALLQIDGVKNKVLSSLSESDPTMRKRAAEVVYRSTNDSNCEEMVTALLDYVEKSKLPGAIEDGCWKIVSLLEKCAAPDDWKVDMFVRALSIADMRMPEDLVGSFLAMISAKPGVRAHAVARLFKEAFTKKPEKQESSQQQKNLLDFGDAPEMQPDHVVFIDPRNRKLRLERVAIYAIGEYGETTSSIGLHMDQVLVAYQQVLASAKAVEDIWLDADAATRNEEMQKLTEITLTSLVKFVCRHSSPESEADAGLDSLFQALPAPSGSSNKQNTLADDLLEGLNLDDEKPSQSLVPASSHSGITSTSLVNINRGKIDSGITTGGSIPDQVCYILSAHASSVDIEVQQRACEYMTLLKEDLRPALASVMAHLPQLDFAAIQKKANQRRESTAARTSNGLNQKEDLLDLLGDIPSEAGQAYPALPSTEGAGTESKEGGSAEKDISLFDVLGTAGIPQKESEGTDSDNLMNLLALPSVGKTSPPSTTSPDSEQIGLANKDPSEQEEPVFDSESLSIKAVRSQEMEHAGFAERVCLICTNESSVPIHNFTLMLAFPKYIKFEIHPLSSDEIAAKDQVSQVVSYMNASSDNRPFRMRFKLEFQLEGSESLAQYEGIFPDAKGV